MTGYMTLAGARVLGSRSTAVTSSQNASFPLYICAYAAPEQTWFVVHDETAQASVRIVRQARALIFSVLVAATFGAFFVAQKLKSGPTVISGFGVDTGKRGRSVFSPNGDGRRDRVRIGLTLTVGDRVSIVMLDSEGEVVRSLARDRVARANVRLADVYWDGRGNDGRLVPDGRYRVRVSLRNQGRAFVRPQSVWKDTVPPRPLVRSIGPQHDPGPEKLDSRNGAGVHVTFGSPALACPQVRIFRITNGVPIEVLRRTLRVGQSVWKWDGRVPRQPPSGGRAVCVYRGSASTARSMPATAGSYLVVPEWRDSAGNVGTPMPVNNRRRRGAPTKGWPERARITVTR